jgi:hypothetical protein
MSSAAETYTFQQIAIRLQIAKLEKALQVHEEKQTQTPENWGFVGDLESVNHGLSRALEALA